MSLATSPRFSLLDAIILVAATACGMGIVRGLRASDFDSVISSTSVVFFVGDNQSRTASGVLQDYWQHRGPSPPPLSCGGQRAQFWLAPCLASWTVAVLGLTSVRRRSGLGRPGGVAGLAFLVAAACVMAARPEMLLYYRARPAGPISLDWPAWWLSVWLLLPRSAGFAVAVSWLSLGLGRCWDPGRGWLDRAGLLLGFGWIVLGLVGLATTWLSVFLL